MALIANRFASFGNFSMPTMPIGWMWRDHPVTLQAVFLSVTRGTVWYLATGFVSMIKVPSSRMKINRRYATLSMTVEAFITLMTAITYILVAYGVNAMK